MQPHTSGLTARIPLRVQESHGVRRSGEYVRTGVPLPRGMVRDCSALVVTNAAGAIVPHQFRTLASWPDQSVKWTLLEALVDAGAHAAADFFVTVRPEQDHPAASAMRASGVEGKVQLDTPQMRFEFDAGSAELFKASTVSGANVQSAATIALQLTSRAGATYATRIRAVRVEHHGALTATVVVDGGFELNTQAAPIQFRARVTVNAHVSRVLLDVQLMNAQAAQHVGGLWDLGDVSSFSFADCSVQVRASDKTSTLQWSATPEDTQRVQRGDWSLYQDSSGGERWNSINHVDAAGRLTVSFSGYKTEESGGASSQPVARRASPVACLETANGWIAATAAQFWEQFPKALRRRGDDLEIGLFPRECSSGFELQGGERKRHSIALEFGQQPQACTLSAQHQPLAIAIDSQWVENTGAVMYFTARTERSPADYQRYVESIVDGPESFYEKRERIDEYGWRNFGDLYADHEAVRHQGSEPFISHYNNQYDFIYGACVHYLRTGDARWRELMTDAARHTIDIDIYHTQDDKPAFSGGLFWHTDHYVPAATSTHRTYSAANAAGRSYGGGPSNEHNYTSGLLHYYYLTGDPEARDAVLKLADWVFGMDDGSRTLLGFFSANPTGLASKTSDINYHRPGRGAGNSINALLDAYAASGRRHYLLKAEELIQRCVHPSDDVPALRLDDQPEFRWSYLVFLQVLGRYLATKSELGEHDYGYHYARESLLLYAEWMLLHEVPYKDVLHKVEIPTETWPAQDIRKAHVMYLGAKHCPPERREAFGARAAFFFERCLNDVLSFETAYLTRPLVLLCVYGYVHEYFQKALSTEPLQIVPHAYDFGQPQAFQTQRELLSSAIESKRTLLNRELRRVAREVAHRLKGKLGLGSRRGSA